MSPRDAVAGSATGLPGDLRATWSVLLAPARTYRSLRDRHPLLAPWIVASTFTVVLTLLTISISQRAASQMIDQLDSPELAEEVLHNLDRMKIVSVAGAPVGLIVRWCLLALVLWAPAVLLGGSARFREILTVVAYSAMPGIIGRGLDLGVAWFEGPEFTPDLVPAFSSAGSLGAFFPAVQSPWPTALLDGLTIFGLWSLALWIIGLREKLDLSWGRASAIAAPVWAGVWILGAASQVISRSMLGNVPLG